MKAHKIRGVDKSVCTAEQKIAYNYAFSFRRELEKIYHSGECSELKEAAYEEIIGLVRKGILRAGIDRRYDMDAIIHCFRKGIEPYLQGFSVLSSYEDIGNTFSCM